MIFDGQLDRRECIATIGCLVLIPISLSLPNLSALDYGNASFLHAVYMTIIAFIFFTILFKMYSKFLDKDIIDVSEFVGGKFLKIFTGLIIIAYLILASIATLSEFDENIRNILLDEAPSSYILTVFFIVSVIGSFIGIKAIFRTGTLTLPVIFLCGFIIIKALIEDIDYTNFTPIFGNSINNFFTKGSFSLGRYEAFYIFLLLAPNIKDLNKTVTKSFFAASVLLLACFFMFFGIFSYPSITEGYSILYELVRMVSYGRFIQRIESIFILIWLIVTFIYSSLALSLTAQTIKKIFNIEYFKRIIPSIAIIVISSSLTLKSHTDVINLRKFLIDFMCPAIFIYSFIIVAIARIKLSSKGMKEELNEAS